VLLGVWFANSRLADFVAAQAAESSQPPPTLVSIAPPGEPGEKLVFWGRVLDYDGRPLEKAAVIAYHTDQHGLYNPPNGPTRVPRLRAVAVTDTDGRFGFSTIRPAAYPNATEPAHIHLVIGAPAHDPRYLDVWFEGDRFLTTAHRERASSSRSPAVIVRLDGDAKKGWTFEQDIRLEGN
jgi:protocatechuate 3,4-dioxygenase beta subunit